ncbi:MAG TPA: hypothetical protein ENF70_01700 [Deltaproteobacteria bacterium]|nr:hypothetical protein [Deltaproteobacteria bacterium]
MRAFKGLLFWVFLLLPLLSASTGSGQDISVLYGTWGHQILSHHNDGTWHTEANKVTFNSDGTGILEYKFNDGGTLTTGTQNFSYTVDSNPDGSFTMWYTPEGATVAEPSRVMISDDGKMIIGDGTDDPAAQELEILIKLDTAKTYTNADLVGDSYMIGYEHDGQGEHRGYYRASSRITSSDGNGTISITQGKFNGDGTLYDDSGGSIPYTVNPDGSVAIVGTGYLSGKVFIHSNPDTATDDWENDFAMMKGDRTYTTADLAGTWAFAGFGDHGGTVFHAEIGTMTCDSAGSCSYSLKVQRSDGSISSMSDTATLSVASDGSFGLSLPGAISYAGAIGNAGNTLIMNRSFDPDNLNDRDVAVAVKCSTCSNLAGVSQTSPQEDLAFNGTGSGYPSPLESDSGWGDGSYPWQISDGMRTYPGEWAHGLAFTGGTSSWAGEACGWRQATIDFGEPKTFNRVVVWHHGLEHVPNTYKIQYWNGTNWVDVFSTMNGHSYLKYPADSPTNWWESWSTPTENTFEAVTSSKVRFALNNCDIEHGWIYEIEVYNDAISSQQQWAYTYGNESGHDYAYSIQQVKDGGYIVAGIKNYSDLWILKLNSKGQTEWQKTYGGPDSEGDVPYEHGFYIRQTIDGGYIVAGGTKSFGAGNYDFWVLKLDTTGAVEWQKTYGGAGYDYATSIQETGDGGYIVAGITQSFPETEPAKIWVLKLNADRTIGWENVYGVSYTPMDVPEIQARSDGGYVLGTTVNDSLLLLELAGDGSIAWQKTYKEGDVSSLNSLRITKDGGYIVAGWVNEIYTPYDIDPLGGKWDGFWLLKLNSEGAIIWQKTYGETQTDDEGYEYFEKAYSVEQTADGGYVVAGSKSSKTNCAGSRGIHDDIWILKLNSDGSIAWQKSYGGDCGEKAYSIVQTSDGGYAMAGYTDSFGAGGADAFILKIDPNGEIPACSAMGTSNAIVIDTSANEPVMSVVVNSTDISPAASNASITDTSVAPLQVCGQILTSLKGDLNNDQAVDLGDIILALQVSAGMNPSRIRSDYASSGADVNGDNAVGLAEALYMLQRVSGIRRELAPLKIGGLFPFTGSLASFGTPLYNAAMLAVKHLSEAGYLVEILSRDTQRSSSTAISAATDLIDNQHIQILIGAAASGVTIPIAESASIPKQIPEISYASTSPLITTLAADEGQDFLFRTCPSDALQGKVLAQLAYDTGYRKASMLYVDNPYGQGIRDEFTASFEALGGQVLATVPHDEAGKASYVTELQQATSGDPDVLVAASYPQHAKVYLKEAIDGNYISTFLFIDGTKSQDIIDAVGSSSLEGMCGTAPASKVTDSLAIFNSAYESEYGEAPPMPFMTNAYDAVVLAALAAYEAQLMGEELTSTAVRDHLRNVSGPGGVEVYAGAEGLTQALELLRGGQEIDYVGASGDVDFDGNGDVAGPIEIWCYEGGSIVSKQLVEP